jgi:GAF domain-containing protein
MLDKAARICDANFGNIFRWDGDALWLVATHNTPPAFAEHRKRVPFRPSQGNPIGDMLKANAAVHIADLSADERYIRQSDSEVVAAVELGGIRTFVAVPMMKDEKLIGAVIVYRQEVRPFTDKQIELVKNFAAQAVIAIENARLLNELRQRTDDLSQRTIELTEALEQQTATSEVLQVISRSPDDLGPVFASMLEKAVRICDATFGNIYRWDGEFLNLVAAHDTPPAFEEARRSPRRPDPKMPVGRMLSTKSAIHVVDLAADQSYIEHRIPEVIAAVELGSVRTFLAVPMLRDSELIGALSLSRQEVRPFSDKQIELVKNFAAQAVIAIENARLFNELRQRTTDLTERTADLTEALEQQTATSEVLQVISSSPGDLQPVFASMLENAVRICDATFGNIYRWDGEALHLLAAENTPPAFAEARKRLPRHPGPNTPAGRTIATRAVVHVADLAAERAYVEHDPATVEAVELGGVRTFISVPC